MKSIIIIVNLWVLLLTIVPNGVEGKSPAEILDILNEMANRNDSIPGIFKPWQNGFIASNRKSVVYKGMFLPKPMEVSMKFTTTRNHSENEYMMYTYLDAIDKESVEVYGIPSIHYYGKWKDWFIMAMTLLDPHFHESFHIQNYNEVDVLILFREFVRVTKYIHSRRVFLRKIDFTHMTFRKQQGFIYDFIAASKYSSPSALRRKLCSARVDWQQFLHGIYDFIRHGNHWSWLEISDDDSGRTQDIQSFAASLQEDSRLEQSDRSVKFSGLRKVFVEFTKYAYGDDATSSTPFYNRVHRVIDKEMKRFAEHHDRSTVPSWLPNYRPYNQPNDDTTSARIAPIASIPEPFEPYEIVYDEVDFEHFYKLYPSQSGLIDSLKRITRLFSK